MGAALLSDQIRPARKDARAYEHVFGADEDYFVHNTPAYWLDKNADKLRQTALAIRLRVGTADPTRRFNGPAFEQMQALGLKVDYATMPGVRHFPRDYYDADPFGSFAFHEANMAAGE
jgi:hypothetical protein